MTPHARRLALAAVAAVALAFAAPAAIAQSAGAPGAPGMHAMHGGDSLDGLLPHLLAKAKASLNLDTSQQVQFDAALALSKSKHGQIRANRQQAKDALKLELATPAPDLAAVAAAADAAALANSTLRKEARAPWLALYATFTPEQKAVVRDLLQQRLERAESFRERMQEKLRNALRPAS